MLRLAGGLGRRTVLYLSTLVVGTVPGYAVLSGFWPGFEGAITDDGGTSVLFLPSLGDDELPRYVWQTYAPNGALEHEVTIELESRELRLRFSHVTPEGHLWAARGCSEQDRDAEGGCLVEHDPNGIVLREVAPGNVRRSFLAGEPLLGRASDHGVELLRTDGGVARLLSWPPGYEAGAGFDWALSSGGSAVLTWVSDGRLNVARYGPNGDFDEQHSLPLDDGWRRVSGPTGVRKRGALCLETSGELVQRGEGEGRDWPLVSVIRDDEMVLQIQTAGLGVGLDARYLDGSLFILDSRGRLLRFQGAGDPVVVFEPRVDHWRSGNGEREEWRRWYESLDGDSGTKAWLRALAESPDGSRTEDLHGWLLDAGPSVFRDIPNDRWASLAAPACQRYPKRAASETLRRFAQETAAKKVRLLAALRACFTSAPEVALVAARRQLGRSLGGSRYERSMWRHELESWGERSLVMDACWQEIRPGLVDECRDWTLQRFEFLSADLGAILARAQSDVEPAVWDLLLLAALKQVSATQLPPRLSEAGAEALAEATAAWRSSDEPSLRWAGSFLAVASALPVASNEFEALATHARGEPNRLHRLGRALTIRLKQCTALDDLPASHLVELVREGLALSGFDQRNGGWLQVASRQPTRYARYLLDGTKSPEAVAEAHVWITSEIDSATEADVDWWLDQDRPVDGGQLLALSWTLGNLLDRFAGTPREARIYEDFLAFLRLVVSNPHATAHLESLYVKARIPFSSIRHVKLGDLRSVLAPEREEVRNNLWLINEVGAWPEIVPVLRDLVAAGNRQAVQALASTGDAEALAELLDVDLTYDRHQGDVVFAPLQTEIYLRAGEALRPALEPHIDAADTVVRSNARQLLLELGPSESDLDRMVDDAKDDLAAGGLPDAPTILMARQVDAALFGEWLIRASELSQDPQRSRALYRHGFREPYFHEALGSLLSTVGDLEMLRAAYEVCRRIACYEQPWYEDLRSAVGDPD